MEVAPIALLIAIPAALMEATLGCADVQVAVPVTSVLLPSINKAVALTCRVLPRAIAGVCGAIATERRRSAGAGACFRSIWVAPQPVRFAVSPKATASELK